MIMTPNGHIEDEDPPAGGGFVPATPVLPSRATGESKPLTPLPQAAADPAPRKHAAPKPRKVPAKKAAPKPRRKTVAKKKAKKAAPAAPKNPNRPLEAKNRLNTVLAVVATLSKQEAATFVNTMAPLEHLTGPMRKRVINALAQVYA